MSIDNGQSMLNKQISENLLKAKEQADYILTCLRTKDYIEIKTHALVIKMFIDEAMKGVRE